MVASQILYKEGQMHESGARLLPSREDSDDRDTVGTKNSELNAACVEKL